MLIHDLLNQNLREIIMYIYALGFSVPLKVWISAWILDRSTVFLFHLCALMFDRESQTIAHHHKKLYMVASCNVHIYNKWNSWKQIAPQRNVFVLYITNFYPARIWKWNYNWAIIYELMWLGIQLVRLKQATETSKLGIFII